MSRTGVSRIYARDPEASGGRILRPHAEVAALQAHDKGFFVVLYDDPRLDDAERLLLRMIGGRINRARAEKLGRSVAPTGAAQA
ncbi:hypothetical protein [Neomegalonema perideroedes]|uniref:hypothetical protein n=1 Tax=Neomegalonema perideroedes TaxID=217219 RepID=UPI00037B48B9|nr:hypothetical protein [Neomegalonema perideroedes]